MDKKTGKHKGAGYLEFYRKESIEPALKLSGELVRNFPIAVKGPESVAQSMVGTQATTATGPSLSPLLSSASYVLPSIPELIKLLNPYGLDVADPNKHSAGFTKLYIGSVPFNVSDADLRTIFEPFGNIKSFAMQMDPVTKKSKGYGFLEYYEHEAAKKALGINGLVVAGRPLRVGLAVHSGGSTLNQETTMQSGQANFALGDLDDGASGVRLDASRRQALMQQLSGEKTSSPQQSSSAQPTKFIVISNMFEAGGGSNPEKGWIQELEGEVREECDSRFGKTVHIGVDPDSKGCVYLMFEITEYAIKARQKMNGRWFGGRRLSCTFVSEKEYLQRYPDACKKVSNDSFD